MQDRRAFAAGEAWWFRRGSGAGFSGPRGQWGNAGGCDAEHVAERAEEALGLRGVRDQGGGFGLAEEVLDLAGVAAGAPAEDRAQPHFFPWQAQAGGFALGWLPPGSQYGRAGGDAGGEAGDQSGKTVPGAQDVLPEEQAGDRGVGVGIEDRADDLDEAGDGEGEPPDDLRCVQRWRGWVGGGGHTACLEHIAN